ncbi:MAG TPA: CPXCG motif-containing cysteine-rich protein, partial [Planctomycetaceae bacterium]
KRRRSVVSEAAYVCDSCGEEVVVPIDVSGGTIQEYVEDCPVCCCPNIVHVEIDPDGVRAWAELE